MIREDLSLVCFGGGGADGIDQLEPTESVEGSFGFFGQIGSGANKTIGDEVSTGNTYYVSTLKNSVKRIFFFVDLARQVVALC